MDSVNANQRFVNETASLVGSVVRVQTVQGASYEGIFRTISSQRECVLEKAHKIEPSKQKIGSLDETTKDAVIYKLILRTSDIVTLSKINTYLDYVTKDVFATDTVISKYHGPRQHTDKELEPWDGALTDCEQLLATLEISENTKGWDANDMFRTNEQQYGVESSYDNAMSGYTIPLIKDNTEEFKEKEAKALKIASEIENSAYHWSRAATETIDQEERISAVVRPESPDATSSGKKLSTPKLKPQPRGKFSSRSSYGGPPYGMGQPVPSSKSHKNQHVPSHTMHANDGTAVAGSQPYHDLPPLPHAQPPQQPSSSQLLAQIVELEAKLNGSNSGSKREDYKRPLADGPPAVAVNNVKPQKPPLAFTVQAKLLTNELSGGSQPSKISRKIIPLMVTRDEETVDPMSNFQITKEDPINKPKAKEKQQQKQKKSTKDFVLNPDAKYYTPRTPDTINILEQPPNIPVKHRNQQGPRFRKSKALQNIMSAPINVSLAATSKSAVATQPLGPRFRKKNPKMMQQTPNFFLSMPTTSPPILASTSMGTPSFTQLAPQEMVPTHNSQQHSIPYPQMYSMHPSSIMPGEVMTPVALEPMTYHDTQRVPSQMFGQYPNHYGHLIPHPYPPGFTPPHSGQAMTLSGPHPGQPTQSQQQQMAMSPSLMHSHPEGHQQLINPNTSQLTTYPTMQHQGQNQQLSNTPYHIGQFNPYFHPGYIVMLTGQEQGLPYLSQQAAAAAYHDHQQMVIYYQQWPSSPTHPQGMPTHTLQGHPIHGHGEPSQMAQLVPHTSMALVPVNHSIQEPPPQPRWWSLQATINQT